MNECWRCGGDGHIIKGLGPDEEEIDCPECGYEPDLDR